MLGSSFWNLAVSRLQRVLPTVRSYLNLVPVRGFLEVLLSVVGVQIPLIISLRTHSLALLLLLLLLSLFLVKMMV